MRNFSKPKRIRQKLENRQEKTVQKPATFAKVGKLKNCKAKFASSPGFNNKCTPLNDGKKKLKDHPCISEVPERKLSGVLPKMTITGLKGEAFLVCPCTRPYTYMCICVHVYICIYMCMYTSYVLMHMIQGHISKISHEALRWTVICQRCIINNCNFMIFLGTASFKCVGGSKWMSRR